MQRRLTTDEIIDDLVEITLPNPEAFLVIRESLSRIGIASKKDNTLYQSCHILHKRGRYFIVMFKELFLLDGKQADITEDDYRRRNTIVQLLESWGLIDQVDSSKTEDTCSLANLKIIQFKDKNNWNLQPKYNFRGS